MLYYIHMERIDDLQLNGLRIIQDSELFCFGTDAVLLADFAKPKKRARVADLGTGTGILPLLLYGREPSINVQALELQESLCALARRSVDLNGLCEKISVVHGDIRHARELLLGDFDLVVSNPPYEKERAGITSANESHRVARFEIAVSFAQICEASKRLLKSGGRFAFIHRSSRLAELFETLKRNGMEPKDVRMIHSYAAGPSSLVLVSAVKDGSEGLSVLPPLIVHNADGSETDEVATIYHRDGK